MSEYFLSSKSSGGRVKVELDSFNYATIIGLKNAADVNTLKFAKKVDLENLKLNVDKLDIDKLKNVPNGLSSLKSIVDKLDFDKLLPVPVDLSKLSNGVKTMLLRKIYIMVRLKILKITCLILLTYLLKLLLMLK